MSNKPNADPQYPTLNLAAFAQGNDPATPTQPRPDIAKHVDSPVAALAGVAERSGAWLKEEAYKGFQDLAGRLIYGDTKAPEIEKDKEPDHDRDR